MKFLPDTTDDRMLEIVSKLDKDDQIALVCKLVRGMFYTVTEQPWIEKWIKDNCGLVSHMALNGPKHSDLEFEVGIEVER